LDAKIRSELAPPPTSKSEKLTVDVIHGRAVLNGVPYLLNEMGANYLNALLEAYRTGGNEWVSGPQIAKSLGQSVEFKVKRARDKLPAPIQDLIEVSRYGSRLRRELMA
jgi:hypothetical protein